MASPGSHLYEVLSLGHALDTSCMTVKLEVADSSDVLAEAMKLSVTWLFGNVQQTDVQAMLKAVMNTVEGAPEATIENKYTAVFFIKRTKPSSSPLGAPSFYTRPKKDKKATSFDINRLIDRFKSHKSTHEGSDYGKTWKYDELVQAVMQVARTFQESQNLRLEHYETQESAGFGIRTHTLKCKFCRRLSVNLSHDMPESSPWTATSESARTSPIGSSMLPSSSKRSPTRAKERLFILEMSRLK